MAIKGVPILIIYWKRSWSSANRRSAALAFSFMKMSETCFACANRMRVRVCNKIPLQQWLDLKTWPKKKARWNFVAYARSSGAGPKTGAGAPSKCIKSPQTFSLYVSASHELGRVWGCVCAKVLAYFMKLGKAFNNTGTPTDRGKLITGIYLALKPNVSFASAGWFGAHIRAFPEFGCHLMAATASCVRPRINFSVSWGSRGVSRRPDTPGQFVWYP